MKHGLSFTLLFSVLWGICGCLSQVDRTESQPPVWEQAKLPELSPVGGFPDMHGTPLTTTNLSATIYDVPADKLPQLSSLWKNLELRGIRFSNHHAFRSNAFRIGRADLSQWEWIQMSLGQIGAVKAASCSLWLSPGVNTDLDIKNLPQRQPLFFTTSEDKPKEIAIGPGKLVLRLRDDRRSDQAAISHLTAYPAFALNTLPMVPKLAEEAKKQEVAFIAAGFKLNLKPDELFVLGPEEYYGDESTLGGLFFTNQAGNFFSTLGPRSSTQIKPAVRIIVVVCTAIQQD